MISILAFIGLIMILYWISKGLKKGGTFLENLGNSMDDRAAANFKTKTFKKKKKVKENIRALQGEPTDDEYEENIRKEINKLTGGNDE